MKKAIIILLSLNISLAFVVAIPASSNAKNACQLQGCSENMNYDHEACGTINRKIYTLPLNDPSHIYFRPVFKQPFATPDTGTTGHLSKTAKAKAFLVRLFYPLPTTQKIFQSLNVAVYRPVPDIVLHPEIK